MADESVMLFDRLRSFEWRAVEPVIVKDMEKAEENSW
jgi:hypothetical protein